VGVEQIRYGLSTRRRDIGRAAVVFALTLSALVVVGCGGGGHSSAAEAERAADVEVVNGALERELTAVEAFEEGFDRLRGGDLALARRLSRQDQEHVDALNKALRGLGGEVEAEAAELGAVGRSAADALTLAYEEENAALAYCLDAERRLRTTAPRMLAASIGASHAQHLVVLRQALGISPLASVPEAFEPGDLPPPRPPRKGG